MKKVKIKANVQNSSFVISLIKGVLIALSLTLIGICIFAFVLRFVNIQDSWIMPINMIIKIISILIGTIVGLKKQHEMGFIKGLLIGLVYVFLSFIIFSLLVGKFSFGTKLVNDIVFGGILGAICGIICVNFKKREC